MISGWILWPVTYLVCLAVLLMFNYGAHKKG
jgi:hypothetical protein